MVQPFTQADPFKQLSGTLLRRFHAGQFQRQHHIFQRGQRRQQLERLEHKPDPTGPELGTLVFTQLADYRSIQLYGTFGGRVQASKQPKQRGFTGTRPTDNGYGLSPIDFQTDPLQDRERIGFQADPMGQIRHPQHRAAIGFTEIRHLVHGCSVVCIVESVKGI